MESVALAEGECTLATLIARKAQKQGQFRLRSFLAPLASVPVLGWRLVFKWIELGVIV